MAEEIEAELYILTMERVARSFLVHTVDEAGPK